ncbi:MAG: PadR family transcriptional regulator [Clostridiaceae bacterium]|jgi:PadR family transcriptional regulator PadR|nr:PadR family transcriptional regulator [Clostridiaceae bacterium]
MKINKELLKGSTIILILSLLDKETMYGYEIIKRIQEKSNGIFNLKEGTLYPILHTLEGGNAVESYWDESQEGRKRKYYRITGSGEKLLKEKKEEWNNFKGAVDKVIWEAII